MKDREWFDVDVLIQSPITVFVRAADPADAARRVLAGEGTERAEPDYVFGEVVDVRRLGAT